MAEPETGARDTGKYGNGLFALEEIGQREVLIVYGGYAMTLDEFHRLPPDVMHYPSQIDEEMVFGIKNINELEDACHLNHSCEPSAGFGGQIFMIAMRKIKKDEEVAYDYAMELHLSKTLIPDDVGWFETMECECGTPSCRKIITDNDWKIPELQKRYDGYFQWYLQEKINRLKNHSKSEILAEQPFQEQQSRPR